MKTRSFLLLSYIILLLSCTKPNDEPPFFEVEGIDFILTGNRAATDSVKVRSNINWHVTISPQDANWLQVSPAGGNNSQTIVVTTTSTNITGLPRVGAINIIPSDTVRFLPKQIWITQNTITPELRTDINSLEVSSTSGALDSFRIQSNLNWNIITTANWLSLTPASGNNSRTIEVKTTQANTNRVPRQAILTLTPVGTSTVQPATVLVTQNGNVPAQVWFQHFGGTGMDYAFPITTTPDGGYLLAGYALSRDGDAAGHHGGEGMDGYEDGFVVKVDANGNKQWSKTYGGKKTDKLFAIANTADGGYVLAGTSNSRDGDVSQGSGTPETDREDGWLLKINATGNIVWSKTFGGNYTDVFRDVIATADGGYVVTGHTNSGTRDMEGNPHAGTSDAWIMKVDDNGNKIWSRLYGGINEDVAHAITPTPDGGFVLAGSTKHFELPAMGDNSWYFADGFLVKVDANGHKVWNKVYGGQRSDVFTSVKTLGNGDLIVTGTTFSFDNGFSRNMGESAIWVMQTNSDGNEKWSNLYGGTKEDEASSIIPTAGGGYLVVGHSKSADGDVGENKGGTDMYVLKLDAHGNKLWEGSFGGSIDDYAYGVVETADRQFVLCGTSFDINGIGYNMAQEAIILKFKAP